MKVYGPFHALSNPLVAISLGLRGAEDAFQVYDRYKEAHKDDFLTKALLTGQPVTKMEGGPFRQLASKVTGGLIHPNVEASGEQLASEILGLRKQEGENIKEAGSIANIRKNVGGEPFRAGTPLAKTALRLGLGDISGPTASETKEQQLAQTKTPEAAAERAAATFSATAPLKLGLARSMAEMTEPFKLRLVGEEATARAAAAGSPSAIEAASRRAFATHAAGVAGTAEGVGNLTLGQYRSRPGGKIYVNRSTLSPASSNMQVKDANANPDLAPIALGKDEQGLAEARSMLKQLGQADRLIDTVFPAIGPSSGLSGERAARTAGISHYWNKTKDPNVQFFYRLKGLLIAYVKNQQGRYPSTTELTTIGSELVPEAGNLDTRSDSNEVAHQKVFELQQKIRDTYLNAAVESSTEGSDAEHDKDIDNVYAPE